MVLLTGTKKNPQFPGNPLEQDLKLQLHNQLVARDTDHEARPGFDRHYIQNDAPNEVVDAIEHN